jgi:phytoene synthase
MTIMLIFFIASVSTSIISCHGTWAFMQSRNNIMNRRMYDMNNKKVLSASLQKDIENLMANYDPILLYVSRLLPHQTALDASALYAWCRRLDEITDCSEVELSFKRQQLIDWEDRFVKLYNGKPSDVMDEALYECIQRNSNSLTDKPFLDMIAGMKADAVPNRTIENMEELELYAYQVAGTVGVMLLPLLNADSELSRAPAIALGKAIQLINILRDASPDAAMGRIYLPQDLLHSEEVSNTDILALKSSIGYRKVVKEVADRAKELLREAEIGKSTLPGIGPLFVQIIVELYRGYLIRLEEVQYDNLNARGERVKISTLQKFVATLRALKSILI